MGLFATKTPSSQFSAQINKAAKTESEVGRAAALEQYFQARAFAVQNNLGESAVGFIDTRIKSIIIADLKVYQASLNAGLTSKEDRCADNFRKTESLMQQTGLSADTGVSRERGLVIETAKQRYDSSMRNGEAALATQNPKRFNQAQESFEDAVYIAGAYLDHQTQYKDQHLFNTAKERAEAAGRPGQVQHEMVRMEPVYDKEHANLMRDVKEYERDGDSHAEAGRRILPSADYLIQRAREANAATDSKAAAKAFKEAVERCDALEQHYREAERNYRCARDLAEHALTLARGREKGDMVREATERIDAIEAKSLYMQSMIKQFEITRKQVQALEPKKKG
jgi:hypothetical protein